MGKQLQAGAVAINMHSEDLVTHRGPNRILIAGMSAATLAGICAAYFKAAITSQITYVHISSNYDQTHPTGTVHSVRVLMQETTTPANYRSDFRNLAGGKTSDDVIAAYTQAGVLLPNSQVQCERVVPQIRTLA